MGNPQLKRWWENRCLFALQNCTKSVKRNLAMFINILKYCLFFTFLLKAEIQDIKNIQFCYQIKLESTSQTHSKTNLLIAGDEEKCSIYCKFSSKENGQLILKRPNFLMAFKGGFLKTK